MSPRSRPFSIRRATATLAGMHELALIDGVVDAALRGAGGARVVAVRLEVGRAACVCVDALRFCFELCTTNTPLADAQLEIDEIDGDALRVKHLEVLDVP